MEQVGKYQVLSLIGQGGFGKVYKGLDPVLQRYVAIKTCTHEDAGLRERFLREAKVAGGLRHPNIVTVFDFGTHEGGPYIVQEFLEGEDLADVIVRGERVPTENKVSWLRQLCDGLSYAHQHGVIHRDVKPKNVRLEPDGRIRIMDFGIAKLKEASVQLTGTGISLGTAGYMSPEQFTGGDVDERSDIFSFGIVAYELMTRERPFKGDTISSLFYQIENVTPTPVIELDESCPPLLAACIEKCLQKAPSDRYQSCAEVMAALEAIGRPVKAASDPDGGFQRAPTQGEIAAGSQGLRLSHVVLSGLALAAVVLGATYLITRGNGPGSDPGEDRIAAAPPDSVDVGAPGPPVAAPPPAAAGPAETAPDAVSPPPPGLIRDEPAEPVEREVVATEAGRDETVPVDDAAAQAPGEAPDEAPDEEADEATEEPATEPTPARGVVVVVRGDISTGVRGFYKPGRNAETEAEIGRLLAERGFRIVPPATIGAESIRSVDDLPRFRPPGIEHGVAVIVIGQLETDAVGSANAGYEGRATLTTQLFDLATGRLLGGFERRVQTGRARSPSAAVADAGTRISAEAAAALEAELASVIPAFGRPRGSVDAG